MLCFPLTIVRIKTPSSTVNFSLTVYSEAGGARSGLLEILTAHSWESFFFFLLVDAFLPLERGWPVSIDMSYYPLDSWNPPLLRSPFCEHSHGRLIPLWFLPKKTSVLTKLFSKIYFHQFPNYVPFKFLQSSQTIHHSTWISIKLQSGHLSEQPSALSKVLPIGLIFLHSSSGCLREGL